MTDMQLLTLVVTLLAIFGAMIGTRKSTEDMRDVLRAEFRSAIKGTEDMRDILRAEFRSAIKGTEDMRDILRAEFKASITEAVTPINLTLQRIENKLDHMAEVQASHSEAIAQLKQRAS